MVINLAIVILPLYFWGLTYQSYFVSAFGLIFSMLLKEERKEDVMKNFVNFVYDKKNFRYVLEDVKRQVNEDGVTRIVLDTFGNLFYVENKNGRVVVKKYRRRFR